MNNPSPRPLPGREARRLEKKTRRKAEKRRKAQVSYHSVRSLFSYDEVYLRVVRHIQESSSPRLSEGGGRAPESERAQSPQIEDGRGERGHIFSSAAGGAATSLSRSCNALYKRQIGQIGRICESLCQSREFNETGAGALPRTLGDSTTLRAVKNGRTNSSSVLVSGL
eukprot:scaffold216882_cov27-Tisochrysis_lutea.AAC.3